MDAALLASRQAVVSCGDPQRGQQEQVCQVSPLLNRHCFSISCVAQPREHLGTLAHLGWKTACPSGGQPFIPIIILLIASQPAFCGAALITSAMTGSRVLSLPPGYDFAVCGEKGVFLPLRYSCICLYLHSLWPVWRLEMCMMLVQRKFLSTSP